MFYQMDRYALPGAARAARHDQVLEHLRRR
jgi:hypothetical protein